MAELSFVSGTRRIYYQGDRKVIEGVADEVTNGGADYLDAQSTGMSKVDHVQATCKESAVAIQAVENSQDGGSTTSNGSVTLVTASGTHDVHVRIVGR